MGRLLGPSEYGALTSIISLLFITSAFSGTIQITSAKHVSVYFAQDDNDRIKIFFNLITKRILVASFVVFALILIFINKLKLFLNLDSIYPLIFFSVIVIIGFLISINRGALQGVKKFKSLGINLILEVLLKFTLGIILVYFGLKTDGAMLGFMIASISAYLIIFLPLKGILRKGNGDTSIKGIDLKVFYRGISLILISTVLFSLLAYSDIILVKHFFSSYDTGVYSAAAQIGRIILFFPAAVSMVVFPRLSEKHTKKESTANTLLKGLAIIAFISVIFLIVYFFFPEIVLKIIYGSKFLLASELVFEYGIFMAFVSLISLQIFYFISIGKYWYLIYLFIISMGQITLIWLYHDSLKVVLIILITNSSVLFLLNLIFIIFYNKKKRDELTTRQNFSVNPSI